MGDQRSSLDLLIGIALEEDVGAGDWTTQWTVPAERRARATIVAKAPGVIAGLNVVHGVFASVDPELRIESGASDGEAVHPGQRVATLEGSARGILTGERVALNFLQRLSGVATMTRAFVDAVEGTGARILDTRKTTPGMRALEKAAVRAGGGENHRFGLHDMVLVKENHIAAAGGIAAAVAAVRMRNEIGMSVEIEVADVEDLREALESGVHRILLDNMSPDQLRECVQVVRSRTVRVETEASGGISLRNVRAIAETGVDFISVGALTHSAPALDLSLLVER